MADYVILADSACDILPPVLNTWGVECIMMSFTFDDSDREYAGDDLSAAEFYQHMRQGRVARTSAVNVETFRDAFTAQLRQGRDILYLGFSSGLSSTYAAAELAAASLKDSYPDRRILTVDSLAASGGYGLLVYLTAQKQRQGASLGRPPATLRIPACGCATGSQWTIWSISSGAAGSARPQP